MTKNTLKILTKIQTELKAPKGNYNSFGKYHYRSAEDILEAVKPLLSKYQATLLLADEVMLVGTRFYVKATAVFYLDDDSISVSAMAREDESKKGMDGSQVTGAASSYARKYALNGLFLIDDNKDADTDEYKHIQNNGPENPAQQRFVMTETQYNQIMNGIAEIAQISKGDPSNIQKAVLQVVQATNIPQWAVEDNQKQERIKNNIERMPTDVREKFEKDKEEFSRIVQKNLQNITMAHFDGYEPDELTEAEIAFYEQY